MELQTHDELPLPLSSSFGGVHDHGQSHMTQHDHHHPSIIHTNINNSLSTQIISIPSSISLSISSPSTLQDPHIHATTSTFKKMVKYKECLKNHAAAMGGNATDGCGEFMPSGEEGTLEALTCSVCNCHRNFHRREVEGEPPIYDYYRLGRKVIIGHHHKSILPPQPLQPQHYHLPQSQMLVPYGVVGPQQSESEEQEDGGAAIISRGHANHHHHQLVRKRFRTKFTSEQKEKMLSFAEKVGWKIQKQEESVVQQFCQEIGVKRRVLKVWMHNNKHNLAKKSANPSSIVSLS